MLQGVWGDERADAVVYGYAIKSKDRKVEGCRRGIASGVGL